MANVSYTRPEIKKLLEIYRLIKDTLDGETAVKEKGTTYLPKPNANDASAENKERYKAYKTRAVFYNVARRTLQGMLGQIFIRPPVVELPSLLDSLIANATGTGLSLEQLARRAVGFNLPFSRGGVFVDYPATEGSSENVVTVGDLKTGRIRPTMFVYAPWEIINWRTIDRGAEQILSLVVLVEPYEVSDDGFEVKQLLQIRVLRMNEAGIYIHDIYRDPNAKLTDSIEVMAGNYVLAETFIPRDNNGNAFKEIPFWFFGAENNDVEPENPNFEDICSLNIAHYRNSADYEESCYITGQPTPVATGLTEEWVKNVLEGKLQMGSTGGIPLPPGANFQLVQAQANTMIKEAMEAKERQMVALGAKLVEQREVERTATEAAMEESSKGSTLSSCAKNVSAAFTNALKWAARWVGQPDSGVVFELNTDYSMDNLSPEERKQLIEEWQKGAIAFEEMREGLRKVGIATLKDEDAKTKITAEKEDAARIQAEAFAAQGNNVGSKEVAQN